MNTKLIHEVADTIERLEFGDEPGKFMMTNYAHGMVGNPESCRSPACIAGWTCFLADGVVLADDIRLDEHPVHERAQELLGITYETANVLFTPTGDEAYYTAPPGTPGHISPERAAATLRRLADTGEVDWGTES